MYKRQEYVYRYGLVVHERDAPVFVSADYADASAEDPVTISLQEKRVRPELLEPLITITNRAIRISSIRMREGRLLVTLHNLSHSSQATEISLNRRLTGASVVKIDGTNIGDVPISQHFVTLSFGPREVKMCSFGFTTD